MTTDGPSRFGHGQSRLPVSILRQVIANKGFMACAILLAILTVSFKIMAKGYTFRKLSLPLRADFREMKKDRLSPYRFIDSQEIPPDMISQLGTDKYLQWVVQEPDRPGGGERGRPISFFVTYYTGMADAVPHIPDTCYRGSGHEIVGKSATEVVVASKDNEITVPLQVLEFRKRSALSQSERVVLYTFHSNGQFRENRTAVRLAIGSLTDRYAYFSKVEVSVDIEPGRFTKEQAVEAARRFLKVAIPVLLEDHWPDWEAVSRQPATQPMADGNSEQ